LFTLTFSEPGRKPQSHPLSEERGLLIGRDAGCDVVLESKDVSRRHARFYVREGAIIVEDLGSQNGVFVRGARIAEPAAVALGAPVEIGDVKVAVARAAPIVQGVGAGARLSGKGREIRLPAKAVIGRGAECDVVLDDDSVSRKHAELARDDRGLYRLRDLKSANGTFLDGKPVGEEPVLAPDGSKLRFGDVELLFQRPPVAKPLGREKILLALAVGLIALFVALYFGRRPHSREAADEPEPGEAATALAEQAQAAIESERFEEAARLAQQAIDTDPLAPGPRKALAQARREIESQKAFADATAKAQVGREDEALRLLAQVPPQSRYFPRARIKAKEMAQTILRTHGANCRSSGGSDECALALDVKCQSGPVDDDPMLKALRAAEKKLPRRVPWSCPPQLAALFRDEGGTADTAADDRALSALYPDAALRAAIAQYARGDVTGAMRKLGAGKVRGGSEAMERLKVVDGRFREGQTALLGNALDRADQLWGEALAADAALMPAGTESFLGRQMRSTLSRAHGKSGDERFSRGQYASAYDEWTKGLAASPRDPQLLDQLGRLEKVAENLLGGSPSCDQLAVAAHITRSDPPSPAHEAAAKALRRCR
jgi:pSer/pThr/pTyr-binding forkhead associated (FHA) protein/tetratricopeptide (TPR) repeat protein